MSSYRGLDWKTGAARRLRPLHEMQQFFLGFLKHIQNWGLRSIPPSPLAR